MSSSAFNTYKFLSFSHFEFKWHNYLLAITNDTDGCQWLPFFFNYMNTFVWNKQAAEQSDMNFLMTN